MGKRSQISRQAGIQASNSAAFLSSRLDLVGVWRWFCRQSTVEVQDLSWDAQNPGAKVRWVCQPTTNLNMLESEKNKNTDKGPVPAPMSQDASSSHQPVLLPSYRECWSSFFQWKSNCSDNKAKIWHAESGRVVFVQLQEGGGQYFLLKLLKPSKMFLYRQDSLEDPRQGSFRKGKETQ